MDAAILDGVAKSFDGFRAVDALSVRVPSGCIYGFLGPNGAGKTTVIRMMMDIIRPDSGRIEILGAASVADAKPRIGYMPEERGLYRRMPVAKVLTYLGGIKGVPGGELRRRVDEWLGRLALTDWADKKVQDLSRGMQQRLQFAVTAISDPDLLILDEPFSGLDPVNLDTIKGIILEMRRAGKTVIFSTHMMDEAERLSDYILLINKGQKVVDGSLEQIRSRWPSDTVVAELTGQADFIADLPYVTDVSRTGGRMEIRLAENADDQELLRALLGQARVRSFGLKTPSLHEIFVRLVGTGDG